MTTVLATGASADENDSSMQQLPFTVRTDSRKPVEDLYDFLGTLMRGWRLIAVCVGITLALAVIYLASVKPVYQASARLLVLQHGGQPLYVANGTSNHDNLFQSVDGNSNSLTTHVMIIHSPLIVRRSLAAAGLKDLSAGSVIAGLSVKLPDPTARVLELSYKTGSRDEAVRVVDSVIKSYDLFLQENYQKNSNEVLGLITKARDELSADLKRLEKEYLEYRKQNTVNPSGGESRTFIARRLDQWDQTISQAMLRSLELRSQLDLGRQLAEDGASVNQITAALGHLSGTPVTPATANPGPATGLSYELLEAELGEVEFQRQTAESLLEHLRAEQAKAVSSAPVSDAELVTEFYAERGVADRVADLKDARDRFNEARRVSRRTDDASLVALGKRIKELEAELAQMWQKRKPRLKARLVGGSNVQAIHQAAGEVMALRAKEAALGERLDQSRAQRLLELEHKHDRLVKQHGPQHPKVQEVREKIARLKGDATEAPADPRQAQAAALLNSIEQGLNSVKAMQAEVEQRFQHDLAESHKSEIGQLYESNLRNHLERQRTLFYSVVDQLKQAQLVSDFGSVTAQVLDPPAAIENRPSILRVLIAAMALGCGLGAGAVYVADQLDARIRSLPEIQRLLAYRVLGAVPLLSLGQQGHAKIALVSHAKPRSQLAETYKSIRTRIDLLRRNWEGKVFMVTSPQPADGKTTTASNLAICMAQSGRKILLIDADLRRPCLHTLHGLPRSPGLTEILNDQVPFHQAVQQTAIENLDVLSTGEEIAYPAELLAKDRLGILLRELRQAYDVVILDTSPLLVVTDPSIIAVAIDGILLILRAAATRRLDVERSQDLLKDLKTPVLGLVVNAIIPGQSGYGYRYYPYGYGTQGRASSSGNGDDPAPGLLSDLASAPTQVPRIERQL